MKNILKKIALIQKEIAVSKDGEGPESQNAFPYFREQDVLREVKRLMDKHGVVVQVEVTGRHHENFYDKSANARYRPNVSADVRYTFWDIDSGESFSTLVSGEGSAIGGDTATRKMFTQSRKIAFLQTFSIGEPDERNDSDGAEIQEPVNNAEPQIETSAESSIPNDVPGLKKSVMAIIKDKDQYDAYTGPIITTIGNRISGDKAQAEWMKDATVLQGILAAVNAGEME